MASIRKHHNRPYLPFASKNRSILLQFGVIGILAVGSASQAGSQPSSPVEDRSPLVSNIDPSFILEITIRSITNVVDQVNEIQTGGALEDSADLLTFGYTYFGLEQDLTYQQINIALDDCQEALDFVQDTTAVLELSETSRYALELTLEDMIEELNSEL